MNNNNAALAEERLQQALSDGDPDLIARTILSNAWPLYSSHYELTVKAIAVLPRAYLDRYPVLRMLSPMTPVLAQTIRPFKPLIPPDDAKLMSPDELDLLTVVQMIAFRTSGDIESAMIYAKRMKERITRIRVESRERTDGPLWYFHHQIGSTLLAAGDTSQALLEFSLSKQLAGFSLQEDGTRMALSRIALIHALRGSYDDASAALAASLAQPAATPEHASSCRASEAAAAALIAVDEMGDGLDAALQELESFDSFELSWSSALLARGRASLARHHPEDALELVRLARDAHRVQAGSFASDVITALNLEARSAMGHGAAAHYLSQAPAPAAAGVLTKLTIVRLALQDGHLDTASAGIHGLRSDNQIGPAQRTETEMLAAWLDFARTDDVDELTATEIHRISVKPYTRRLFASLPRQFVERVRARLSDSHAEQFTEALTDIAIDDMRMRPQLTRSETRVLKALTAHTTTAQIAAALHVSPNTVKSQLQSAYRKLGCSTRDDAIRAAYRLRLVDSYDHTAVPGAALHAS